MPWKLFVLIGAMLFAMPLAVNASDFVEGRHYRVLDLPKSKQQEVREYFSFYCKQCYSQQAFMQDLLARLPRRANHIKNHVAGQPNRAIAVENLLTTAVLIADKMRMRDQVVDAIFKHIHENNQDFESVEDVRNLFISVGGNEFMFDSSIGSYSIEMQLAEMQKSAKALKAQGEANIPNLIINGRYKPLASHITNIDEYKRLIYFLLRK
ncbi:hypothetical protein DXX93_16395 [Thalassotalea euphylliae]|uniref:Thiol:disulfide interchange protein n=1 Tax=Thalassotalea euphylliae TaxID=1655234 RepID=A0A3E0TVL4_9GAMM|nr:hypothetical protein [Thalassotalea euphylliae]REL27985.1 hypothetical protein DXX93_16395 [Thalassotalea euphylliae]